MGADIYPRPSVTSAVHFFFPIRAIRGLAPAVGTRFGGRLTLFSKTNKIAAFGLDGRWKRPKAMTLCYTAYPVHTAAPLDADWHDPLWRQAEVARIDRFHSAGSSHRPDAQAKLLYDVANLYLRFRVEDRYVVARHTQFQDPVWRDSCVEFFVQPRAACGYFNFEINCGGALLSYYIEDATRTPNGFARFRRLSPEQGGQIEIRHSLPATVMPEQAGPVVWHIGCRIPLTVVEAYTGPLEPLAGQIWRGNFYKCADDSSHPHWGSWAPIGEELNFHQPSCFAPLKFAATP
jgi:hypothetical protein